MKINRATDYTIRLLTYLAKTKKETTSMELAKSTDIPFNHIAKLIQILSRNGYLLTRKGKGGGLKLAISPRKINLAEIVELIEGPITMNDCIFHRDSCRFSATCKARRFLAKARAKMRAMFAETTILDLVPNK